MAKIVIFFKNATDCIFIFKKIISYTNKPCFLCLPMFKGITKYDLAPELELSPATISRRLSKSTMLKKAGFQCITKKAAKMSSRRNSFARSLGSRHTKTLGVIVPRLNSYFMNSVLSGIEDIASKEGYQLIISQLPGQKAIEINDANTMCAKRVDGLLMLLAENITDISRLEPFFEKQIPVVFFDLTFPVAEGTAVVINNFEAAKKVTTHLIQQRCRKIRHLAGNINRDIYSARHRGYQQARTDNNVPFKSGNIYENKPGEKNGVNAANYIGSLNLEERPDGVFFANDMPAVYCIDYIKKNDIKVPDDIVIAGFNNDEVRGMLEPKLKTTNYCGYEVGKIAVSCLINLLKGDFSIKTTSQIVLGSSLLVRGTSMRS
jgi:LacI family transcriptional regulator